MCDSVTVCHLTVNNCSALGHSDSVILCVSVVTLQRVMPGVLSLKILNSSLSSASDVSMIVYEFKDGVGTPKECFLCVRTCMRACTCGR